MLSKYLRVNQNYLSVGIILSEAGKECLLRLWKKNWYSGLWFCIYWVRVTCMCVCVCVYVCICIDFIVIYSPRLLSHFANDYWKGFSVSFSLFLNKIKFLKLSHLPPTFKTTHRCMHTCAWIQYTHTHTHFRLHMGEKTWYLSFWVRLISSCIHSPTDVLTSLFYLGWFCFLALVV